MRKPVPESTPVHFRPGEGQNFAIYDNGGSPGEHRPYFFVGEIAHADATGRWQVYADGRLIAGNLETFERAKMVYMHLRETLNGKRNGTHDEPCPPDWSDVAVTCWVWDHADEWRTLIFTAMRRAGHAAADVQDMLKTPQRMELCERGSVYVVRLPDAIAAHLRATFPEDAEIRG